MTPVMCLGVVLQKFLNTPNTEVRTHTSRPLFAAKIVFATLAILFAVAGCRWGLNSKREGVADETNEFPE
jgi:hypothetical protein